MKIPARAKTALIMRLISQGEQTREHLLEVLHIEPEKHENIDNFLRPIRANIDVVKAGKQISYCLKQRGSPPSPVWVAFSDGDNMTPTRENYAAQGM